MSFCGSPSCLRNREFVSPAILQLPAPRHLSPEVVTINAPPNVDTNHAAEATEDESGHESNLCSAPPAEPAPIVIPMKINSRLICYIDFSPNETVEKPLLRRVLLAKRAFQRRRSAWAWVARRTYGKRRS
jgi:hypothetical protein